MRNTKEIKSILTAIYCINRTSSRPDKDINNILEYAFQRIYGANTNLLLLACIGQTKKSIMPSIKEILETETKYKDFNEKPW